MRGSFKKPIWASFICKWLILCDSFPVNNLRKELIKNAAQGFLQHFPWQAFRHVCQPSALIHMHRQQDFLSWIHTGTALPARENTLSLSFSQSLHVEGEARWLKSRTSRGPTSSEVMLTVERPICWSHCGFLELHLLEQGRPPDCIKKPSFPSKDVKKQKCPLLWTKKKEEGQLTWRKWHDQHDRARKAEMEEMLAWFHNCISPTISWVLVHCYSSWRFPTMSRLNQSQKGCGA